MNQPFDDPELRRQAALAAMETLGLQPDAWQAEVVAGQHQHVLLNCARQAGKSTAVALLCVLEAVHRPESTILLLSASEDQARELLRVAAQFHERLGGKFLERSNVDSLRLTNGSRIISLPTNEKTVRVYSN